jgi:hypothetical protein
MPNNETPWPAVSVGFNVVATGTALNIDLGVPQHVVTAAGFHGPWYQSLGNFRLVNAKTQRALLVERILDAELPRYAEALKRLGEWTT